MSAITPQGHLFTMVRNEALRGTDSILFLKCLFAQVASKLLVVWDGSPIHRSGEVKSFLAAGAATHIHLEKLPAYAPDLNPDEGTWQYLKYVELRNTCCLNLQHLHHELNLAIRRLRRKPHIVCSFFAAAGLPI